MHLLTSQILGKRYQRKRQKGKANIPFPPPPPPTYTKHPTNSYEKASYLFSHHSQQNHPGHKRVSVTTEGGYIFNKIIWKRKKKLHGINQFTGMTFEIQENSIRSSKRKKNFTIQFDDDESGAFFTSLAFPPAYPAEFNCYW